MAPTILKFLRWIFFLPGGNKAEGMQQMLRTRDRGVLLRTEAAYQIYQIDIWYEQRIDHARTLLEELRERHPHNPLFLLNLAQLHDVYRNDRPAAMAAYQALVDGAGQGTLREPLLATRWGRRGLAVQHDRLGESDRAVSELQAISAERPMSPHGYLAAVQLDLAQALDRLGRRPQAVAAYQAALAAPLSEGDWEQVRKRAKAGLQTAPPAARGEAWRLSVEGWRAYERRAYAEAAAALDRSLTLAPQDGIAWYRRGVVHEAQGQPEAARAAYERAAQVRPSAPPVFVARALHGAGRLALAAGDVARARGAWDAALAVTGAEPATVEAVRRALAALQAPEISGPRGSSVLETLRVTRVAAGR